MQRYRKKDTEDTEDTKDTKDTEERGIDSIFNRVVEEDLL